jgi:DNA-binding GntR family transcriptional regulator
MLDLSRLRLLDDRPTAIERLRIAVSRVRWPPKFDFRGSIYAALESQGVYPTRAEAFVEVVDAMATDAELLGVVVGRGLLCIRCVTSRTDGLAISLETTKYHPDRYRFRAILERRAER